MGLSRPGEPAAERLHAVMVPDFDAMRERQILNTREILRFEIENASVHLSGQKRILSYDIWTEDLPRTTTRKLKRFELEQRVRELHEASGGEATHTRVAPRTCCQFLTRAVCDDPGANHHTGGDWNHRSRRSRVCWGASRDSGEA